MTDQLLGIIYGLASALVWGSGDFSGGFATKRDNVFTVVFISQFFGVALLAVLILVFRESFPPAQDLLFGALAGIGGMMGVLGFYRGLSQGQMGVFAPLVAVITAVLPVIAGIIFEGAPSTLQLVGFLIAFVAVWFLSFSGKSGLFSGRSLALAFTAGLGFSIFLIAIDQADSTPGIFWPLLAARCASITILLVILRVRGLPLTAPRPNLPVIAMAGILDTGGNIFFALAAQVGRLDIAAVLSSLYPATTVFLAWMVLKEKLSPLQWVGVVLALVALFLIAL